MCCLSLIYQMTINRLHRHLDDYVSQLVFSCLQYTSNWKDNLDVSMTLHVSMRHSEVEVMVLIPV